MTVRRKLEQGKTGPRRNGQNVPCIVCGSLIYRDAAYIARTKRITCASKECRSQAAFGENNPFWGKSHSELTREKIRAAVRVNPPKGTGPKKGIFKQSPEARAKMSEASKQRWLLHRDMMLASRAKPPKPRELMRYRRVFTPNQRAEWSDIKCKWCGTTEKLVLDHIIPVLCGGANERKNAQTLTRIFVLLVVES